METVGNVSQWKEEKRKKNKSVQKEVEMRKGNEGKK